MSDYGMLLLSGVIYKVAFIASGTVGMVLGYKLLRLGVGGTEQLDTNFPGIRLAMRGGSGTFFSLFGATIIGLTACSGWESHNRVVEGPVAVKHVAATPSALDSERISIHEFGHAIHAAGIIGARAQDTQPTSGPTPIHTGP
jgi:hypothetical protein